MKEIIEKFYSVIRAGEVASVDQMIEKHPTLINQRDDRGSTPLILATYYGHKELAELLLGRGAPIDATDGAGNTALMGVCFKGSMEIAKSLIEKGANVNNINSMGATALIYTCMFNKIEMANLLLENGAETTVKDAKGQTAYDHAKSQGNGSLMDLLKLKA